MKRKKIQGIEVSPEGEIFIPLKNPIWEPLVHRWEPKREKKVEVQKTSTERKFLKFYDNCPKKWEISIKQGKRISKFSRSFKNFLKTRFSTEKEFLTFCSISDVTEIKNFGNKVNKILINYQKYLKFCNYTDDQHSLMISLCWLTYKEMPKKIYSKTVIKGVEAMAEKSERRKKKDKNIVSKGADARFRHTINRGRGYVNNFLKWNAGPLRAGLLANFENGEVKKDGTVEKIKINNPKAEVPKAKKLGTTAVRKSYTMGTGASQDFQAQYSFLATYAYKWMRAPEREVWNSTKKRWEFQKFSATHQKAKRNNLVKNKAKRGNNLAEKIDQNIGVIFEFVRKINSNQGFLRDDEFSEKGRGDLTVVSKILKLKRYSEFEKCILHKNPVMQQKAKNLAIKFYKEFFVKRAKWKSIRN